MENVRKKVSSKSQEDTDTVLKLSSAYLGSENTVIHQLSELTRQSISLNQQRENIIFFLQRAFSLCLLFNLKLKAVYLICCCCFSFSIDLKIDESNNDDSMYIAGYGYLYKCVCGRMYTQSADLHVHRAENHSTSDRPFECWLCHKS